MIAAYFVAYRVDSNVVREKARVKEYSEKVHASLVIDAPQEEELIDFARLFDHVLVSQAPQGLGQARRNSLLLCYGQDAEWCIVGDADEQYPVEALLGFMGDICREEKNVQIYLPQRTLVTLPEPASDEFPSRKALEMFENFVVAKVANHPEASFLDLQTGLYAIRSTLALRVAAEVKYQGFLWDLGFAHWFLAHNVPFKAIPVKTSPQVKTNYRLEDTMSKLKHLISLVGYEELQDMLSWWVIESQKKRNLYGLEDMKLLIESKKIQRLLRQAAYSKDTGGKDGR